MGSSMDDAILAFRILAGLVSILMSCSPIVLTRSILKTKTVGVASFFPLIVLFQNSHVWMIYGYVAENFFPVFSCFLFGEVCSIFYITVYYKYTDDKAHVLKLGIPILCVVIILSIYAIVGGLGYTGQTRHQVATVLGLFADLAGIFLYGAPMEKLYQVLKHRSAVFLNYPMVIAGFVNNCIWMTYGVLINNWFIRALNILFITMGIFTICLYHVYNPKTHPYKPASAEDTAGSGDNENEDELVVAIELSPRSNDKPANRMVKGDKAAANDLPSPEYSAMNSPLGPLRR